MNKLKNILLVLVGTIGVVYLLFVLLPIIFLPFSDSLTSKITSEIQKSTGFRAEFKNFRIITTPKLTIGAALENLKVYQPDNKLLMDGDNFKIKMSLIPLLTKKIEVDIVSADKINLDLYVKNDGKFLIEDLVKADNKNQKEENEETNLNLPFNLKFSNHLPNFKLREYNLSFIDVQTQKRYVLSGFNTKITDFIINKKVKVQSKGALSLDGYKAFNYDIKILNKIMPEYDINDLISGNYPKEEVKPENKNIDFNIIETFKLIKKYALFANLKTDITLDGTFDNIEPVGKLTVDKLSMLINGKKLPDSDLDIVFNKNSYDINSNLNTAQGENTKLKGVIKNGKKPNINLNCISNITLKSAFDIVKTFADIIGMNDLKTLSGNGKFDINFNIKSDFKKLTSNGHIKLTNGQINYGAYGVKIDNLLSDIILNNNKIVINKLGFTTFSIPFNINGTISPDATLDIKVQTSKLPIKPLFVSLGQASILKENPIYTGAVTVFANAKGKLDSPKITGRVTIDNLKLKNIPSDIMLSINPVVVDLNSTKTGFTGTISASNILAHNPALDVSAQNLNAKIDEKTITILDTNTKIDKNNAIIYGTISDYMKDKINLNLSTKGQITSNLSGVVNPNKMTLDLKLNMPNESNIIIPGLDKSKLITSGNLNISGAMSNPILKGSFNIPSIEIPEIPVSMKNVKTNIDGPILNGNATVEEFINGGIKAENIKTDYKLSGSNVYLNNMKGSAFYGSFEGDIVYNMSDLNTKVKFKGDNMNALKAIEGAAGIKNALTGTLFFNADVSLKAADYNTMMKTLKGSADFEIKNGYLANLGSLDRLLLAQNIVKFAVLKAAGQSASSNPTVKNASHFENITGKMNFSNAIATLSPIELKGPSMAYYITGNYNLLNGYSNIDILGRVSNNIVSAMGNIGTLAVGKITGAIPVFGALTSAVAQNMNVSTKTVDISKIPSLTNKNATYKDFKAIINGNIESASSVKSFRWINDIQVTDTENAKQELQENVQRAKEQINQTKTTIKDAVTNVKSITKEDIKEKAKEQGKAVLMNILTQPQSNSKNSTPSQNNEQ